MSIALSKRQGQSIEEFSGPVQPICITCVSGQRTSSSAGTGEIRRHPHQRMRRDQQVLEKKALRHVEEASARKADLSMERERQRTVLAAQVHNLMPVCRSE